MISVAVALINKRWPIDTPAPTEKKLVDLSTHALNDKFERRGHVTFNWDDVKPVTLPNGLVSKMYRVGSPSKQASPTVFKVYYPPDVLIEPHTHDCDYTEMILEGSQKVGRKWLYAGDIRVGIANRGYGPLLAGPEGATILFVFANGNWPALPLGKSKGKTLHSDVIANAIVD